jgi:hypothetical protein
MLLQFLKNPQNAQKSFAGKELLADRSRGTNCRRAAPKSASVLSQFAATYSQKCVTAKRAKSNKNFIDEHLLYKFRHS